MQGVGCNFLQDFHLSYPRAGEGGPPMNLISILIGIVASLWMIIGMIPLFGWIQWPVAALCVVGAIFGLLSQKKTGFKINLIVGIVAIIRAIIFGGFI